ncbi:MAG: flagellar basal body-associated FliL family protein [Candidatus Binatia bacterium]|nr:flagellar basal body-associated FliL family protein [Candidatus Binatia bacterium]
MAAAAGVEGEGPQGEEAEVKSGGGSKKLLLIGLPVLLLSGGAGAYFAGLLPIGAPEVLMAEMETDPSPDFAPTSIEPLDPFIANLSDENAGRYIKTTIQLEFAGAEPPAWLDARMPQIRDHILSEEMIGRTNQAFQADSVRAVYFTEFIVQ